MSNDSRWYETTMMVEERERETEMLANAAESLVSGYVLVSWRLIMRRSQARYETASDAWRASTNNLTLLRISHQFERWFENQASCQRLDGSNQLTDVKPGLEDLSARRSTL